MKLRTYLAAILAAIIIAGCIDSQDGFLHFDFIVHYDVPEQTLPGDPLLSALPPQPLPDIPIELNGDAEFNSQIFNHLVDIEMKKLRFSITSSSTDPGVDLKEPATPDPDDWSFLESIEIWFRNPATLQEGIVAYVASGDLQLQPGNTILNFVCVDTNLLNFFDSSHNTTMIIRAVGTFPPDDVIFQINTDFYIVAALIK